MTETAGAVSRGLMFHHFQGSGHPSGQGAITAGQLEKIIAQVGRANILDADDWHARALAGRLRKADVCLTFDDNLRCQYDVALPVLRRQGIRAFWFVHTGMFCGCPDRIEVYRYVRNVIYRSVDEFYEAFFSKVSSGQYADLLRRGLEGFVPEAYNAQYSFYTNADRTFRFVRDHVLGDERYREVMDEMVAEHVVETDGLTARLWMSRAQIAELHLDGHMIGLHSHTHPMKMSNLDSRTQAWEYGRNFECLAELLQSRPRTMSHPCGSYTEETLAIIRSLGIETGFRDNDLLANCGILELPREDHTIFLQRMKRLGKVCT